METNNLEQVILFFAKRLKLKVNEDTQVNNDLNLTGIDAESMWIDFANEFDVNLEKIDFSLYFVSELGLSYLWYKFFDPQKLKRKPLTVKHLAAVIDRGHWFEPETQMK